jgi:hypothetical protein
MKILAVEDRARHVLRQPSRHLVVADCVPRRTEERPAHVGSVHVAREKVAEASTQEAA